MAIRVVVIDDSVVVRRTIVNVLAEADDLDVVGTASDGSLGLRKIAELKPDLVTLDVEMPGMNGIETLTHIRRDYPDLPVIMYSTLTERGATATLDALSLGAVDYATKPSNASDREGAIEQVRTNLIPLVRLWGVRGVTRRRSVRTTAAGSPPVAVPAVSLPTARSSSAPTSIPAPAPRVGRRRAVRMVTIGVSTGGPDALAVVMPSIPQTLAVPVTIVQHMPPVFTAMLAKRLDQLCPLPVTEAVHGEEALPGHVYLAPGGHHLEVRATAGGFSLALTDGPPENSCRPAVDVLFRSAAMATGGDLLAVVMTGMGQDGMLGARDIRAAGGTVLAQDEATSVVWGMPGAVVGDGAADGVFALHSLGSAIGLRTGHSTVAGAR